MNYTKPEVAILGDAACVIQQVGKGNSASDAPPIGSKNNAPAYDLDD
jgi:hypothetical protein